MLDRPVGKNASTIEAGLDLAYSAVNARQAAAHVPDGCDEPNEGSRQEASQD